MRRSRKNTVIIKKDFANELNEYAASIKKNMATKTRDELAEATANAVEAFYDDYGPNNGEPVIYRRHYKTFREHSYMKYYKRSSRHGKITGGVMLTPEKIPEDYHDIITGSPVPAAQVAYLFYIKGSHGLPIKKKGKKIYEPKIMNTSPYEMILDKRDEIVNNIVMYADNAIKEANKGGYTYLRT